MYKYAKCSACGKQKDTCFMVGETCHHCLLQSPTFELRIELGASSSKNYEKALNRIKRLKDSLEWGSEEQSESIVTLNIYDLVRCRNRIRSLISLAGAWKGFECFVCDQRIVSRHVPYLIESAEWLLNREERKVGESWTGEGQE